MDRRVAFMHCVIWYLQGDGPGETPLYSMLLQDGGGSDFG